MASAEESNESTAPSQYDQEEKKKCRKELIEHAVRALTTERNTSACVHRDHVRKAWQQLRETSETSHFNEQEVAEIEEEIADWELLHDSKVQTRTPSDLRVCFLAGDNPLNDYNVFLENGVLPQNMWAVEKDYQTLKKALENMKQSKNGPNVFKGNFLDLLRDFKDQFDIIYFDACGSLPSKNQKTLKAIGYVFLYNRLTSPGALITTFSFPPKKAEETAASNATAQDIERTNLSELTREYLKYRLVNTSIAQKIPHLNEEYLTSNDRSDEENYSDYIVHQIIDTAYMYIPAHTLLSSKRNSLLEQSFVKIGDIMKALKELLPPLELDREESPSKLLFDKMKEIEGIRENLSQLKQDKDYTTKNLIQLENETNIAMELQLQLTLANTLGSFHERELKEELSYLKNELKKLHLRLDQLKKQEESMLDQLKETEQDKERKMLDLSAHEAQPPRILGQLGHTLQKSDNPLCKAWCSEVFPDWKSGDLKQWQISLLLMVHLLTNWIFFIKECSNKDFKGCLGTILRSLGGDGDDSIFSQFVDVPNEEVTTQMIATLLYGQMACPSFPVVEKLKRIQYTAKTRQMFSNVFIFDRCRYVYDQFPSVHTANSVAKPHKQMVFRMAVDGLRKHLRHICEEDVFKYCNVVEQGMQQRVSVIPKSTEITTESTGNDDHQELNVDQITADSG